MSSRFTASRSICLAALFVAGCGSTTLPVTRVASTEAAIRAAQETGATQTPRAALHLHYAELERTDAERLAHAHQADRGTMALLRSEADANLAIALTREATAEREAQAATRTMNNDPTMTQQAH